MNSLVVISGTGTGEYSPCSRRILWREETEHFWVCLSASQEWSPSHNLKSLRKKQLATREAMARQTVVSDTELSIAESSVIRCRVLCPATAFGNVCGVVGTWQWHPESSLEASCTLLLDVCGLVFTALPAHCRARQPALAPCSQSVDRSIR